MLRLHDTLAHLGEDEFVVIAEEVGNLDVARLIANRLLDSVREPLRVKDIAARLKLTVGIALPTGNESAYELLGPGPRDDIIRSQRHGDGVARTRWISPTPIECQWLLVNRTHVRCRCRG